MRTPSQRNYDPHRYIFRNKKSRAKASGTDFSITFEEITFPTHCPVFGVLIDYSLSKGGICNDHSPSFDRIDPSKGYVSGNVIVVSNLANRIKTNATVEQLERVASYYRQLIPLVGANDA